MSTKRAQPAHRALAQRLGVAIVTGQHQPGAVLPGEIELAGTFGVSRSVIRESLRMLSAKGLVESRPKIGTRVRDRNAWNMLDPELLGWMFEGAPPARFVRSLFDLRMIVEPAAAELAARMRSARQLSRMGHALEEMATYGLADERGRAADQVFHAVILEATDNELLVSLSASIAAAVRWTTFFKYRSAKVPRNPLPEHHALFEAIAATDAPTAMAAMETLIRQARIDTEQSLEEEVRREETDEQTTTARRQSATAEPAKARPPR